MIKVDNVQHVRSASCTDTVKESEHSSNTIFDNNEIEHPIDSFEKTPQTNQKTEKNKKRRNLLIGIGVGVAVAAAIGIFIAARKARINQNFEKEILKFIKSKDFENIPMFKNLNKEEISALREQFNLDRSGMVTYFGVVSGAKPACWVDVPLEAIAKHQFPTKVDIRIASWGGTHIFNQEKTLELISKHRDIFTERLGLARDTEVSKIYQKILDTCGKVPTSASEITVTNNEDLMGLLVGFSKKNSMIFQLEALHHGTTGIYNPALEELRHHPKKLSKILLEVLHSPKSPYKNLDPNELKELEKAIKKIKDPYKQRGFRKYSSRASQYLFGAVPFTDDPKEFKRINEASQKFLEEFKLEKYLKQPEHLYEPQSFKDFRENLVSWVGEDGFTYCKYKT